MSEGIEVVAEVILPLVDDIGVLSAGVARVVLAIFQQQPQGLRELTLIVVQPSSQAEILVLGIVAAPGIGQRDRAVQSLPQVRIAEACGIRRAGEIVAHIIFDIAQAVIDYLNAVILAPVAISDWARAELAAIEAILVNRGARYRLML